MNLPPQSQLTDKKYQQILNLIDELEVNLDDIEEKFIRGGGRGGQKINKSANAVQLRHLPTGTNVKYQKHRARAMNRILALRELLEKLNPDSKKSKEIKKIRKQKKRRQKKQIKTIEKRNGFQVN